MEYIIGGRPMYRTIETKQSFTTQAWQLLLSQGLLYSIGGSLCYYPTFMYLSEWFVARRGFANGICFAGTAGEQLTELYIVK